MKTISAELAEQKAAKMLDLSNKLASIVVEITQMGRSGWQAILDESESWENIDTHAPEVIRALRIIAMRLDRAALIKSG